MHRVSLEGVELPIDHREALEVQANRAGVAPASGRARLPDAAMLVEDQAVQVVCGVGVVHVNLFPRRRVPANERKARQARGGVGG